jgi:hypothetical protein
LKSVKAMGRPGQIRKREPVVLNRGQDPMMRGYPVSYDTLIAL